MKGKLLDTSTCISILRGEPSSAGREFLNAGDMRLYVSSIVTAELLVGVMKARDTEREIEKVEAFLNGVQRLDFGIHEARSYARIRHHLESIGLRIGGNDLLIAATALANELTLVTHNTQEFERVPELILEDWS